MKIITAVLAATVATTLLAAPAQAGTWRHQDARGDVVALPADDDQVAGEPAPDRRDGDVLAVRATNGPRAVRVVLRYDRLDRPAAETFTVHVASIRTSGGKNVDVTLATDAEHPRGQLVDRPCRGATGRVSHRDDRVVLRVPRRCLGPSRWVRVGAGSGTLVGETLYADDALQDGSLAHEVALGPRIRR